MIKFKVIVVRHMLIKVGTLLLVCCHFYNLLLKFLETVMRDVDHIILILEFSIAIMWVNINEASGNESEVELQYWQMSLLKYPTSNSTEEQIQG